VHQTDGSVGQPHTSRSRGRLPSPFLACLVYAVRVCVPPKRWLLLGLPVIGAVLFGLLARVVDDPTPESSFAAIGEGLFGLVLPFACLIVGDAVLGAEVRSGAFALTWLSPTPFATIVVARWLAGWIIAAVALAPAMALAAVAAGVPNAIAPIVVATVAAAGAYIALFVLIGASVQRAALWSLAIVLLGERLLGEALAGIAQLSPQWLARTAYADLGPDAEQLLRSGVPSGAGALLRLAIVTAVCLALSIRRIRRPRLVGAPD
jgi:ABC-type transport system involved in cytochrome c biogenesis permease component